LLAFTLGCLSNLSAQEVVSKEAKVNKEEKKLTEIQKLKAENLSLKIEVAQLKAAIYQKDNQLSSLMLTAEQAGLLEEFRIQLGADKDDKFDWKALTFSKPIPTPKQN
jgi:hypothetical protein